jgi:hypothetical protein
MQRKEPCTFNEALVKMDYDGRPNPEIYEYAGLTPFRSARPRSVEFYHSERPYQSLEDRTPGEVMKGTQERSEGSRQRFLLARAAPSGSNLRMQAATKTLT